MGTKANFRLVILWPDELCAANAAITEAYTAIRAEPDSPTVSKEASRKVITALALSGVALAHCREDWPIIVASIGMIKPTKEVKP